MTAYQFVVLRYVHDVAVAEFVNVGIVLWTSDGPAIRARFNDRYGRASRFFADFDGETYRLLIKHIDDRFNDERSVIRQLDLLKPPRKGLLETVHAVVPEDDSAFQWSSVMGGVTDDIDRRADELFEEFVLRHELQLSRDRRDEQMMKRDIEAVLRDAGLASSLMRNVQISGEDYEYAFYRGWNAKTVQVLEPISFDFINAGDIVEKANTWSGRLYNLSRRTSFGFTGVLAPPTESSARSGFQRAMAILQHAPQVRLVVTEEHVGNVVDHIASDLERG